MVRGLTLAEAQAKCRFSRKRAATRVDALLRRATAIAQRGLHRPAPATTTTKAAAAAAASAGGVDWRTGWRVEQCFVGKGRYLRRVKLYARDKAGLMHHPSAHVRAAGEPADTQRRRLELARAWPTCCAATGCVCLCCSTCRCTYCNWSGAANRTASPRTTQASKPRGSYSGSDRSRGSGRRGLGHFKDADRGVVMDGLLIRKHLVYRPGFRARSRKWVKVWCILTVEEERGVRLAMFPIDSGWSDEEEVTFEEKEMASSERREDTCRLVLTLERDTPEYLNLVHSISFALKPPGYDPTRPFVLNLTLAGGGTFLFQTPTSEILLEWTKTVNYWATRLSKEPLRGAISNAEYGWADAAWERLERERIEREDPSGAGASAAVAATTAASSSSRSRKVKILEWVPQNPTDTLVSHLSEERHQERATTRRLSIDGNDRQRGHQDTQYRATERFSPQKRDSHPTEQQLASMRKTAETLARELEEHASYKSSLEGTARKSQHLVAEYDRYSLYAQIL
ncbi:hypothetical protein HK405_013204, partial [Cladochytrium tenue]